MADESDPFAQFDTGTAEPDPFAQFTVEHQLSAVRSDQAKDIDPKTAVELYKLTQNEVGGQGIEAQQAFLETVFNRAKVRKQSIADTINDRNYYPAASFKEVPLHDGVDTTDYQDVLNNVINGSNISDFATGNASGNVGFGGGPQTAQFGGEKFGIEEPDLRGAHVPTKAVEHDPFEKFADTSLDKFIPETFSSEEQVAAAERIMRDHPVFKNALDAASEIISGMLPKSATDYVKALFPPVMAYEQARQVISSDKPLDALTAQLPLIGRIPEIVSAEQTPPGSKERFTAAFKTVNDILLIASAAKARGFKAKESALPPASTREIPAPQPFGNFEPLNPVRGSGKFRATYRIDKELGDRMEGIGAAREAGALRSEYAWRNIVNDLDTAQQTDVGRYLLSERLQGVNPKHPQILSPDEMARIGGDKKMGKAIDYYRKNIEPEMENLHKRAGTTEASIAGQRGQYIPLIPKTEELLPGVIEGLGPQIRAGRASRITKFAREAKGMAKEYDTDLRNILREGYSEPTRKALLNEFYQAVKRKGLSDTDKFEDLPPEIANNLNEIIGPKSQVSGLLRGVRSVQRGATSIALTANPAELMNHERRQLNQLAAKPQVGVHPVARIVEALIPYIGPKTGAFIRSVTANFVPGSENVAILQDIFDSGGGSSRSFSEMYQLRSKFAKGTGLAWLQRKTHNLLFGIPKGRGIQGWDLRMRVQLEKIRRAAEGNRDPQRIREFANQLGQYGAHPDWIIGALRELNPYAATTLPMRWTELKTAMGVSGLKSKSVPMKLFRQAETLLRGTGGTILGLTTANYLLSGKWPWENDPGHEFDLNLGMKGPSGKNQYLKFRVIAPELSRPVSTTGLPAIARERTAKEPQPLSALLTSLANQGLSIVGGPAQNALLTALSGKVPYLVKSPGRGPEIMDVTDTPKGGSRGIEQVKRTVAGLNPLGETIVSPRYEPELTPALKYLERPIGGFRGIRPFGSMFSESYEKKPKHTKGRPRRQSRAQMIAKQRRQMKSPY